jgi:hypothetical protein
MPLVAAAAITAGATIYSSSKANSAAKKAANAQVDAAQTANDTNWNIYQQQRTDQMPWLTAGAGALSQMTALTQPGADVQGWLSSQPGYQFGMNQGINALSSRAATAGLLNSGANLKNISMFAQDYAGTKFGEHWNRLAGLAGVGQTATGQIGQAGQNYASQFGQNALAAGNARASAYQQQGQNTQNMLGGLAGIANNYLASRAYQPSYRTPPFTANPVGYDGVSLNGFQGLY